MSSPVSPLLDVGKFEPVENMVVTTFGEGGFLAKKIAGYSPRRSQMVMAYKIDQLLGGIDTESHLVGDSKSLFVEGPTGTGKSLSYLVPLSYHCARTNQTGLVVTANNNLLHQIVAKDLPAVRDAVPWKFTFTQLKGLNNYLCQEKWESAKHEYHEVRQKFTREMRELDKWVEATKTGDKNELAVEPPGEAWHHISTSSDGCLGKSCKFRETCFGFAAKGRAKVSQVVVTNYHMLFIDLRVRLRSMGARRVLPPYRYLIMDEVHKAADIARDFFARTISRMEVWRISNALKKVSETEGKELDHAAADFFDRAGIYAMVSEKRGQLEKRNVETMSRRIREPNAQQLDSAEFLKHVARAKKRLDIESARAASDEEKADLRRMVWKLEALEVDIGEVLGLKDKFAVSFVERASKGKNVIVGSKPSSVAEFLGMGLFARVSKQALENELGRRKEEGDDADVGVKDVSGWVDGQTEERLPDAGSPAEVPKAPEGYGQVEGTVPEAPKVSVVQMDLPGDGWDPLEGGPPDVVPAPVSSGSSADSYWDPLEGGPPETASSRPTFEVVDELEGGGGAPLTQEEKERRAFAAKVRQAFGGRGIICTSATLATPQPPISFDMFDGTVPDPFDFVTREMGAGEHGALVVESPFDYRKQALLVIPEMPPPDRKDGGYDRYRESMARALAETVKQAKGRTLGLFTSWVDLDVGVERLRSLKLPYRILVQGESPNPQLIAEFRKDVGSILLGTESFFTGVDVQGEALSCVFISKLPFPNPQDPVVEAIGEDKSSFNTFTIPQTVITLKQMFGRLIRTTTDRGVVVIADSRLLPEKKGGKAYGKRIVEALPKARRSMSLDDIGKFLSGEKVGTIRKEWIKPGEDEKELI